MFRPIRTLISLAVIAGAVWFSFSVRLGPKTLAQHLDAIGETPEAKELMNGARDSVNPALEEAKQRVLGEQVEAPTYIQDGEIPAATVSTPRQPSDSQHPGLPGGAG